MPTELTTILVSAVELMYTTHIGVLGSPWFSELAALTFCSFQLVTRLSLPPETHLEPFSLFNHLHGALGSHNVNFLEMLPMPGFRMLLSLLLHHLFLWAASQHLCCQTQLV